MPWEYDNDTLEALCSGCHKKEHNIKPKRKFIPKKKKSPVVKTRTIRIKNG
jgi:5-methylcytosine-specific restriction endonuclease McrA